MAPREPVKLTTPNTGAYAATHQTSNAYGNYGSSVVSKNGNTAYTQHSTTAAGTVATAQTSDGGRAAAAAGRNGNSAAAAQTANGNKYAAANGNVYKNTGSGWSQTQGQPRAAMERKNTQDRLVSAAAEAVGKPGRPARVALQAARAVAQGSQVTTTTRLRVRSALSCGVES